MDDTLLAHSEDFVDRLLGPGTGARHTAFLAHLHDPALQELLHRCHELQADEQHLTIEEHYLIGMCVLCGQRDYAIAGMFAKILRHRGVTGDKILTAVTRLAVWTGATTAADAAGHIQRAVTDYDRHGIASLEPWLPVPATPADDAPRRTHE